MPTSFEAKHAAVIKSADVAVAATIWAGLDKPISRGPTKVPLPTSS